VRSTFIVGFPGETEEHFTHLERFLERAALDHVGVFTYSGEEGTPAAAMASRPDPEVARERQARLLERQRPISLARRQALVGQRLEALVEGVCEESEHLLSGRHQGMAPDVDGRLLLADGWAYPGTLVEVDVVEAFADDVVAHIVTEPDQAVTTVDRVARARAGRTRRPAEAPRATRGAR
jgi:ribosomal protein S12 methylthiotransferase